MDNFEDVKKHEAFTEVSKKSKNLKIILSGSCQLESLWCTEDKLHPSCSISHLLELELKKKGTPVDVYNLAVPGKSLAHNLITYLKFLSDRKAKVFIWHDEFFPEKFEKNSLLGNSEKNRSINLFELYGLLKRVQKQHPEIEEVQSLFKRVEGGIENLNYEGETNNKVFSIPKSFSKAKVKTDYLRFFRKRVQTWAADLSSEKYFEDFKKQLDVLPVKPFKKPFYPKVGDHVKKLQTNELYPDFNLVFSLVDKLNHVYGKRMFYYIGPEAQCADDDSYNKYYKKPLLNVMSTLKSVDAIDLSDLKLIPRRDTFNCINMTISGNYKVAHHFKKALIDHGVLKGDL